MPKVPNPTPKPARSDLSHKLMVFVVPAITFSLLFAAVLIYGLIISNPFQLW